MSTGYRMLLSNVIFNRIEQHFELPQAELKIPLFYAEFTRRRYLMF